jgi:UMF1 family MFS transporter
VADGGGERAGAADANAGAVGAAEAPREVWGWALYDWAISAFSTTVVTVLLGPYLTGLAQASVGPRGTVLDLGPLGRVTAESFYPLCVSAAVGLQVLLLPALGALADFSPDKKRPLLALTLLGAAATTALSLITGDGYLLGGLLFVVANLAAGACGVLYNAFLPASAPPPAATPSPAAASPSATSAAASCWRRT